MIENRCDPEMSGPAKIRGKSIGLSGAQWSGIISHLHRGEPEAQKSEQSRQYEEYLRKGSRAMVKSWENSIEKQRERKAAEKERRDLEKVEEGEKRYLALKESDDAKRMEQIAIAQSMMDRVKIGQRQLDSAYLLADVLSTRQLQRQINADAAKTMQARHLAEGRETMAQSEQGAAEMREKICSKKRHDDSFKREMYEQYQAENTRRQMEAKKIASEERKQRNAEENEMRNQMEMERVILMRKKEMQRRNALEAMRMAEQRRLRMTTVDDLEKKLISIAANGQHIINDTRKRNDRELAVEKEQIRNKIMTAVFGGAQEQAERAAQERKIYYNSVAELEQKFKRQEQAKQENNKRLKMARIQAHLVESEAAKRAKQQQLQERQWDMANRFRNQEVNAQYEAQCRQNKLQSQAACSAALQSQMHENQAKTAQKAADNVFITNNDRDDQQFFEYAQDLIDETAAKKRPILPLLRVVEEYKKTNALTKIRYDREELLSLNSGASGVSPRLNGAGASLQVSSWKTPCWRGKPGFEKC